MLQSKFHICCPSPTTLVSDGTHIFHFTECNAGRAWHKKSFTTGLLQALQRMPPHPQVERGFARQCTSRARVKPGVKDLGIRTLNP